MKWSRLPKTDPDYFKRIYINESGKRISRWEYQTIQHSGINPRQAAKTNKETGQRKPSYKKYSKYQNLVKAFKEKTAHKLGIKQSQVKVRGDSESAREFKEVIAAMKKLATESHKTKKPIDKSAKGELAKLLVRLNLRQPEWDMPVGES